ncbi:MAG: NMD3-related protein [Candidatus Aenigmarchaeota archaeon]|nr:NMD3-related protein [Candidatus Aenigmarchaeota archaeon]
MFCIKCGKTAVAGNFCEKCFLESESLFDIAGSTIDFCPACKNYRPELKNQIMKSIKTKNKIIGCHVFEKQVGNKIFAKVACKGIIQPLKKQISQEKTVVIVVKKRMCENCIKLSGGYYEACIQVRGDKKERILKKIQKFVRSDEITNIIHLKEGVDVRLTNKKSAASIVGELRRGFDVKESYKLVGKKKGKELYRNFYAIR